MHAFNASNIIEQAILDRLILVLVLIYIVIHLGLHFVGPVRPDINLQSDCL